MTGNELFEAINELRQEHGELPVYVWADHGQWAEAAYSVSVEYLEDTDVIHEDDLNDYDLDDLKKVILVS